MGIIVRQGNSFMAMIAELTSYLDEYADEIDGTPFENVSYDTTHISGTVQLEEDGRLILSVPHEKGWTVVLDGEDTEPELFGGTLISFDLEAGEHTIEMHYVPHGQNAGVAISIVSVAAFIVVSCFRKKKKIVEEA